MMKIQTKKSKTTQYAIGGTVAVVILALWIAMPLMSGSSLDSSVSAGNPFRSKVADIGMLGSDISSEGGAPGSPLSGEMINNPATSGEDIASSLFQSGPVTDETSEASASATADASASAPAAPGPSGSAGAPAGRAPAGKLAAAASLSGSNSNSMTTGGKFDKFFGSGNAKAEVAPITKADLKGAPVDKKNSLVAMLNNSAQKSELAAKTGKMDDSRGGASSAFGASAKGPGGNDLNGQMEQSSALSGLQMGQTAQDLKKNDPSLSKTKVTPPSKPEDVTNESDEMKKQIKMMIIQMVLKAALGIVFQGMMPTGAGA